jgi:hypothetical protein
MVVFSAQLKTTLSMVHQLLCNPSTRDLAVLAHTQEPDSQFNIENNNDAKYISSDKFHSLCNIEFLIIMQQMKSLLVFYDH